jgi:hypothetical protein
MLGGYLVLRRWRRRERDEPRIGDLFGPMDE